MSLDPTSGKSKKNKPSFVEFDFAGASPVPKDEGEEEKITSVPPAQPALTPAVERPFGKPISPHFEKESLKILPEPTPLTSSVPAVPSTPSMASSSSPVTTPSSTSGGTALGAFRAQSTVLPSSSSKPTTVAAIRPAAPTPTPPPSEDPMSSSIPSMSDFRRNAERQAHEQKTTGNILSGIAYALLAAILIVASLAALGGYVMWRQIKSQATTVAQLSDKLNVEVATLREEAVETRKAADEVIRRQQDQINKIASVVEQQRAAFTAEQKKKDRDIQTLQSNVKKLENRIGSPR